jgi:hypothetical protein
MQIYEITKLQKQLEEGLLDGVKAAIQTVKTGASNGGLKGIGKALVSPQAYQQAQNQVYKNKSDKNLSAIQARMNAGKKPGDEGYWIAPGQKGYDAQQAAKQLAKNPKAAQKVDQYTASFQKTFGPDIQYQTNPDAVTKVAPVEPVKSNATTNPYSSQTQQNISAQNRQMSSLSGINEAPEYTSPGGIVIPGGAKTAGSSDHLPLSKFSQWADAEIPELKGAEKDPDLKPEVDAIEKSTDVKQAAPIFKKLLTKAFSNGGNAGAGSMSDGTGLGANTGQGLPPADFITLIKQNGLNGLTNALKNDKPRQPTGSKTLDATLRAAHLLAEELKAFKAGK